MMARMRVIKPEFWSDEKLGKLSILARLVYIGLWNLSDDFGVVKGNAVWIKGQLFPYDEKTATSKSVRCAIDELSTIDRIRQFDDNGETYYYITTFVVHQKIDRPSKYRNPEPPKSIVEHSSNDRRSIVAEVKLSEVEEKLREDKEYALPQSGTYARVMSAWNVFAEEVGLDRIKSITNKRAKGIKSRLNQDGFDAGAIYEKIRETPFLLGDNDRGWKCDFDFVWCSPEKWVRIIEGKYLKSNYKENWTVV